MLTCDCGADAEDVSAGIHNHPCTSTAGPADGPSDHYALYRSPRMAMPKPKPVTLTPEQEARVIDQRNAQSRTAARPQPKTAAPKPTAAKNA